MEPHDTLRDWSCVIFVPKRERQGHLRAAADFGDGTQVTAYCGMSPEPNVRSCGQQGPAPRPRVPRVKASPRSHLVGKTNRPPPVS